ncbi:MAG TPA: RDD family protein [Acidimicrobiales bacterium]
MPVDSRATGHSDHDGPVKCSGCGAYVSGDTCGSCNSAVATLGVEDEVTGLRLGGWWRRVGATFSDNVIMLLPSYAVFVLFAALAGAVVGVLAGIAAQGVYQVRLLSMQRGQTIGNRIALTRVRDEVTGGPITRNTALKRWAFVGVYQAVATLLTGNFALYVLVGITLIDGLYPLVNSRKQALHDRFAGTIVVMA